MSEELGDNSAKWFLLRVCHEAIVSQLSLELEWEVGCQSSCGLASIFFFRWSQGFSVGSHHVDWLVLPHSMTALDFLHGSSGSQIKYLERERESKPRRSCTTFYDLALEGHIASHSSHSCPLPRTLSRHFHFFVLPPIIF